MTEVIGTVETWQATMNLCILRIPDIIESLYGGSGRDRLQQAWRCLENGKTEWRDVVIVAEVEQR